MCFSIRGVYTKHIPIESKLSEHGCYMNQDGGRLDESSPFAVAKAQYALVEANRMKKVPYGSIISIYLFLFFFWVLCSMWFHACNIEVNVGCPHLFSI